MEIKNILLTHSITQIKLATIVHRFDEKVDSKTIFQIIQDHQTVSKHQLVTANLQPWDQQYLQRNQCPIYILLTI